MFFVSVFVFGREDKSLEFIQAKSRQLRGPPFFFWSGGVPRAIYSHDTNYEVTAFVGPPPSNGPGWG